MMERTDTEASESLRSPQFGLGAILENIGDATKPFQTQAISMEALCLQQ